MELIRPLWVIPLNFLGDCLRHMIGVGPRWRMHHRLARKLVDQGSWFCIPLTSGTQSPIFDAIEYLVKVEDRDAIPRLMALFEKYCGEQNTVHEEKLSCGTVAYLYGPQDYMPRHVQYATAKALLSVLWAFEDMPPFVEKYLGKKFYYRLGESAFRELFSAAIRYRLEIDPVVFHNAFLHLERLCRAQEARNKGHHDDTPVAFG